MPQHRRWTLMLVPDGCDSPRSVSISERTLRRLGAVGSVVGLIALVGTGLGMTSMATGRLWLRSDPARERALALQARLDSLADTIQAIERRDEQIRLLAGLPADSAVDSTRLAFTDRGTEGDVVGSMSVTDRPDVDRLIRRANLLAASFAEVSDTLARNVEKFARIPSIMPTAGWLSSAFSRSRFHPILHYARPHEGIDVSAPMGAPIVAPAAGTVTLVTRENGYGNVLEIDHGYGIVTKYAHCSRIVVRQGQHVNRGQVIANVGSTGLSTGPHLHYEIHVHGKVVNPLTYVLPEGAIPD
ncbi:MAG: M23 family metallopeptidase [Gemmatimonadaceae bacterium]|nr:M23 family metallopeptidase [Gemmatimonadaceae bacterium]